MNWGLAVVLSVLFLRTSLAAQASQSFRGPQPQSRCVRVASQEKDEVLWKRFAEAGFPYPPKAIFSRALRKDGLVELWASAFEGGP
jgi:hypothetical protein